MKQTILMKTIPNLVQKYKEYCDQILTRSSRTMVQITYRSPRYQFAFYVFQNFHSSLAWQYCLVVKVNLYLVEAVFLLDNLCDFSDHHNTGSRFFCQFCTWFLACLVAWCISSVTMSIYADQKSQQYSILLD